MIDLWPATVLRPWWLVAVAAVIALSYLTLRKGAALGDWPAVIEPKLLNVLAARRVVVAGTAANDLRPP